MLDSLFKSSLDIFLLVNIVLNILYMTKIVLIWGSFDLNMSKSAQHISFNGFEFLI